ncbi:MAG: hypothetical protein ACM3ST_05235, partial [Bdellovibrio bacteriovorus]
QAAIAFPPAVNGHRLTASQYGDTLGALSRRGEEPLALYVSPYWEAVSRWPLTAGGKAMAA